MGDRVNFAFSRGEDKPVVVLYSHWGYTSRYADLAAAVEHARPRWGDSEYCTRMIISHLLKDQISSELHYGIFASTKDEVESGFMYTDEYVFIDLVKMTVQVDGIDVPFRTFVELAAVGA